LKYIDEEEASGPSPTADPDKSIVPEIHLDHANFSWLKNSPTHHTAQISPVLKDVTMSIPNGQLTMVVGDVGSGKSSLLLALLKELAPSDSVREKCVTFADDRIDVCPVAYVAQRPWLLNASIKDNILFGHRLNKKRYDHVIQVITCQISRSMSF
jgi:ABC-type transport system involved in cytochrome bd biosynthesis fused ATPase/permease subunit